MSPRSRTHGRTEVELGAGLARALRDAAHSRRLPTGAYPLAAVVAVLARYTGADRPEVGAARPDASGRAEMTLVDPGGAPIGDGTTLAELLARIGLAAVTAPAATTVAPVCVVPEPTPHGTDRMVRDCQLVLHPLAGPDGSLMRCAYDPEEYPEPTIGLFLEHIRTVLLELVLEPRTTIGLLPIQPPTRAAISTTPPGAPPPGPARSPEQLGPIVAVVAELWRELLGVPSIEPADDFFALGGHSLVGVHLANRLSERFGVDLPGDAVFGAPTVRELAALIAATPSRSAAAGPRPRPDRGTAPLSYAQERIWFFEQLRPGTAAYHIPVALELAGEVDLAALTRALRLLLHRHEALRTTFSARDSVPEATVHPDLAPLVRAHDLRELPVDEARRRAEEILAAAVRESFDLERGPLVRADVVRRPDGRTTLLLTLHHLVADGWSVEVLRTELGAYYQAAACGLTAGLPELAVQYGDVAAWQRAALEPGLVEGAERYWRGILAGAPDTLDLPAPSAPQAADTGYTAALEVPDEVAVRLGAIARECRATLFLTLLTAYGILLSRYTGRPDVVIGTTIAGRDRPELEGVVGPLFNTLPLRLDLSEDRSFRLALDRIRDAWRDALAYRDVPFDLLVERLAPRRDVERTPLVQALFEITEPSTPDWPDQPRLLDTRLLDVGTAKLDLILTMTYTGGRLSGVVSGHSRALDRDGAQRFAAAYAALLGSIASAPERPVGELDALPEPDRRLIADLNDTGADYPGWATLPDLFERQVARTPQAPAVTCAHATLTYAELNERANQLARLLRERRVGPETPVGLCVSRSPDLLVGALGIMKAGGAYVPLDPGHPPARLNAMLTSLGVRLMVGHARLASGWYEGEAVWLDDPPPDLTSQPVGNPPALAGPGNLAYVIFTSGSTGAPKGVLLEHRGLVNYLHWCAATYVGKARGGAAVFSSYAFDMIVPSLYAPLLTGQPVHLVPPDVTPGELAGALWAAAPYAFLKLTPGHLDLLTSDLTPSQARELATTLVVGADAFRAPSLAAWRRLDPDRTVVLNEYGPTEASVANSVLRVDDPPHRGLVPIGRPIPNTTLYVLGAAGRPQPVGAPGELYIGGVCVARGYANRPGLTAQRFVPNPFATEPGARLYRTGDLGRLLPGGDVEFLGRVDEQLKIDGYRIEPAEVAAALSAHPDVHDAVVVGRTNNGRTRLVGYVVPAGTDTPSANGLRAFLAERLPPYLVPAAFACIPAVPLNSNGKLDRAALPAPDETASLPAPAATGMPQNALEEALRQLWGEVLGRPARQVGTRTDFFALGGRSLDVVRLAARIRATLRVQVSPALLFQVPTVAGLAHALTTQESTPGLTEKIARAVLRLQRMSPRERQELRRAHPAPEPTGRDTVTA